MTAGQGALPLADAVAGALGAAVSNTLVFPLGGCVGCLTLWCALC